jgi:hypothetical protein
MKAFDIIKTIECEKQGNKRYFFTAYPEKTYSGAQDYRVKMLYVDYPEKEARERFISEINRLYPD